MPGQRLATVQPGRGSRDLAQPRKQFVALREADLDSIDNSLLAHQTSQTFIIGVHKFIRRGVECFLVVVGTKVIGRALKGRFWSRSWIDIHSTHWAHGMLSRGNRRGGVNLI